MRKKIISLALLGSIFISGVQAHAATINKTTSTKKTTSAGKYVNSSSNTLSSSKTNNSASTEASTTVNDQYMAQVEQAIFNKVNEERAKAGVAQLSYNTTMEKYARIKSQDMGVNNYFSHTDKSGNYITTKMKADGVTYQAWGENIAYIGGVTDPVALADQFMTNWMNSEGHKKNILSTDFSSIGIGVCKVGNKVYATQEFYN